MTNQTFSIISEGFVEENILHDVKKIPLFVLVKS